jgi:hypothetical protein
MRKDAGPSVCDVVGCDLPATGTYLDARDSRMLEFGICEGHYTRLQNGEQPVVVAERFDLADLGAHPVLILE